MLIYRKINFSGRLRRCTVKVGIGESERPPKISDISHLTRCELRLNSLPEDRGTLVLVLYPNGVTLLDKSFA